MILFYFLSFFVGFFLVPCCCYQASIFFLLIPFFAEPVFQGSFTLTSRARRHFNFSSFSF